ncbi:hypothetical protein [Caulobacter sp.]|uniref:hypothetical protein n=1 Tax=Caulobacter sp. TaxID=78 RepID=UPI003BAFE2DF
MADLRRRVMSLRESWIGRGEPDRTEFHTLGAASYLDFCCSDDPQRDYLDRAPRENQVLWRAFGDLYETLRAALEARLGEPVRFTEDFALPGFHIFSGEAIASAAKAPVHFDGQYQYLPWGRPLDLVPPLSFTMPVALPEIGGGLDVWNLTPNDVRRANDLGMDTDVDRIKDRKHKTFHPYTPGVVALHSGLLLHRIGDVGPLGPGDHRITLQGHGVRLDGAWLLHW